jgi:uncharacterized repeat protein (TIGR03843 family)
MDAEMAKPEAMGATAPEPPEAWRPDALDVIRLLTDAEVLSIELTPAGSNYTFYAALEGGEAGRWLGVYKPQKGETPLRDFPDGTLYRREYASYLVSETLGWGFVPPTVVRNGPHGVGTMQLFVSSVREANYFTLRDERTADLQRMALFDALANNADRKASHCLLGLHGEIWGIDHGLTFHHVPKLRTVIWDYQGDPIPAHLLADLERLCGELGSGTGVAAALSDLLHPVELEALARRIEELLTHRVYPPPGPWRSVPWPPL